MTQKSGSFYCAKYVFLPLFWIFLGYDCKLDPSVADVPGETILIGSGPEFAPEVSPDPLSFLFVPSTRQPVALSGRS
jgi:hypothetical protein